jgi:Ca2+:H+ antiporter
MLAILGLLVPAVYYYSGHTEKQDIFIIEELSIGVAAVLIIIYIAGLVFSLHTHKDIFHSKDEVEEPEWSQKKSMIVLVAATIGVALESEFLIGSLEHVVKSLGWSEIFIGVIIVAIIGNAAEHGVAVVMAMKNKIDLSLNVSLSSSTQIALFVAPVLVFVSLIFSCFNGKPAMDLLFSPFEILAIFGSVYTVSFMAGDGEFNWFEGAQLLGVYIIMGVVFFFIK